MNTFNAKRMNRPLLDLEESPEDYNLMGEESEKDLPVEEVDYTMSSRDPDEDEILIHVDNGPPVELFQITLLAVIIGGIIITHMIVSYWKEYTITNCVQCHCIDPQEAIRDIMDAIEFSVGDEDSIIEIKYQEETYTKTLFS